MSLKAIPGLRYFFLLALSLSARVRIEGLVAVMSESVRRPHNNVRKQM